MPGNSCHTAYSHVFEHENSRLNAVW